MIFRNAEIYNENFDLVKADISVKGEKIEKIGENLDGDGFDLRDLPFFPDLSIYISTAVRERTPETQRPTLSKR